MSLDEIHKSDVGTTIQAAIVDGATPVNISTASLKQLIFKKPDLSTVTKSATFTTNGSDGLIYYQTESGFLDQAGAWSVQARVTLPTGDWRSSVTKFTVYDNLA